MKRFSVLLITLMMIASNCFAMTFSQPIKLGRFYTQIQRSSGFHAEGASSNKGTRYDKVAKYIKNYGWDKGLATFGEGIDALYIYYDYEPFRKDVIRYSTKKINLDNKEILLEIRVVPGYKHTRQSVKLVYKNANAIVLVYDITKKENL